MAKHHRRVTSKRVVSLLHVQVVLRFWLLSDALVSFTIEILGETPRTSISPVHVGGRTTNLVDDVLQDSRPTWYNYNGSHKRGGVLWVFLNSPN
jgi:YD repeat-containing protein